MTDLETIVLRTTVIAGQRYDDDYTVIWRGMSIGRIMKEQWPSQPLLVQELPYVNNGTAN
jgi:hypothetical protein